MTVGELKKELEGVDDNLEVTLTGTMPPNRDNCNCGDYCYCPYEDIQFSISQISRGVEYNTRTRNQTVTSIVLIGDRI